MYIYVYTIRTKTYCYNTYKVQLFLTHARKLDTLYIHIIHVNNVSFFFTYGVCIHFLITGFPSFVSGYHGNFPVVAVHLGCV
jgi:hypothetical protein